MRVEQTKLVVFLTPIPPGFLIQHTVQLRVHVKFMRNWGYTSKFAILRFRSWRLWKHVKAENLNILFNATFRWLNGCFGWIAGVFILFFVGARSRVFCDSQRECIFHNKKCIAPSIKYSKRKFSNWGWESNSFGKYFEIQSAPPPHSTHILTPCTTYKDCRKYLCRIEKMAS